MNMDEINITVLRELQEYAQLYFESIVELNTVDGKCTLKPGKYSAKDMQDNSHKSVFGHSYPLPEDSMYDEIITIKCGTFECEFPYRSIFTILARWEAMCKAGKLKAVFEIGEYEEKSAKVLINDRTILGTFKTKTMKLQRIAGNWWGIPKEIRKEGEITAYYELNGVMFAPGKTFYGNPRDDANKVFTDRFDDAKITELLVKYISDESHKECEIYEYYIEVMKRAGVHQSDAPSETPQIVRVEIVRDFDGSYYANLYDANGNGYSLSEEYTDFRTLKTLCKKEYGVCLPNLSQIEFENHGRKSYAYTSTEKPQISTGTAETVNVSVESVENEKREENERIMRYAGIALTDCKNKQYVGEVELPNGLTLKFKYVYNLDGKDMYEVEDWQNGKLRRSVSHESRERILDYIADIIAPAEPLQSPITSESVNRTTELEKRDTELRNKPKRRVRRFRTTEVRTIKGRLIVGRVPRRCSTAHHFAGVSKMVAAPPDYAPPIRGDCKIRRSIRAKPLYFPKTDQINYFKPP